MATGRDHREMSPRARAGLDRAALEELYTRLETPMYNVVYRWLWDAEEARDVVQEAFCRLWRVRDTVELDTVEPFVYKIAVNLASNRRRKRRLLQWISWDRAPDPVADQPDAGQSLALRQRLAAVKEAVDRLPERYKRVVVLCELAGMSYARVAQALGIPPGTVASRRHAAIERLRRSLSPLYPENGDDESGRDDERALERASL